MVANGGGGAGGDNLPRGPGAGVGDNGPAPTGSAAAGGAKPRQGKTLSVGAVRTVKYFRFTEHELEMVAEPQRDAARSKAIAAFSLGLFLTTVGNFSFGKPDNEMIKGAWTTVAAIAVVAAVYYWLESKRQQRLSKTRLQAIKDEHDFT